MTDIGTLTLQLQLATANFNAQLTAARRRVTAFGSVIQGIFQGIGQAITSAVLGAVGSFTNAIGGALNAAQSNFRSFDAELQRFSALSGLARDQLGPLREEIDRLGVETSQSPQQVIEAANTLLTLGANAETVQDQLAGVVAVVEATGAGTELAASVIQSTANVFGISADQIADQVTLLRNTTAAGVGDVQNLLQQAGATAASVGVDFTELAAAFGTLRDNGVSARVAATGLRNVLSFLAAPSDRGAAVLQELGVAAFDAEGNFVGLTEVAEQFARAFEQLGLTSEQQLDALTAVFGRAGAGAVTTLIDQVDGRLRENIATLSDFEGAAAESSATLVQGFAGALRLLEGSLETFSIRAGEAFSPILQGLAELATEIVNSLLTQDGLFDPLLNAANALREAFADPALVSNISQAFGELSAALIGFAAQGLNALTAFFSNPGNIQRITELIGGFTQAVIRTITVVIRLGSVLASLLGAIASRLAPAIGQLINALSNPALLQSVASGFANLAIAIGSISFAALRALGEFFSNPGVIEQITRALGFFGRIVLTVVSVVFRLGQALGSLLSAIAGPLIAGVTALFTAFTNPTVLENIAGAFSAVGAAIGQLALGALDALTAFFSNPENIAAITSALSTFAEVIGLVIGGAFRLSGALRQILASLAGPLIAGISTLITAISDPQVIANVAGAFSQVAGAIAQIASSGLETLSGFFSNPDNIEAITNAFSAFVGILQGAIEGFRTLAAASGDLLSSLSGPLIAVFSALQQAFSDPAIQENIVGAFTAIASALAQISTSALDALTAFFSNPETVERLTQAFIAFSEVFAGVTAGALEVGGALGGILQTLTDLIGVILGLVDQLLPENLDLLDLTSTAIGSLALALETLNNIVLKPIAAVIGGILTLITRIITGIGRLGQLILDTEDNLRAFLGIIQRQEFQTAGGGLAELLDQGVENITPRFTGGPVQPGKVYSAAEKGAEALVTGAKTQLITRPSLIRPSRPGRILDAVETRRRFLDAPGLSNQALALANRAKQLQPAKPIAANPAAAGEGAQMLKTLKGIRADLNKAIALSGNTYNLGESGEDALDLISRIRTMDIMTSLAARGI